MKTHTQMSLSVENSTLSSYEAGRVPFQLLRVARATGPVPGPRSAEDLTFLDAPGPPGDAAQVRHDLIGRVRRQIEAGTYESQDKIDAVLDVLVAKIQSA